MPVKFSVKPIMFDKGDVFNKNCNMELYLKTLL